MNKNAPEPCATDELVRLHFVPAANKHGKIKVVVQVCTPATAAKEPEKGAPAQEMLASRTLD